MPVSTYRRHDEVRAIQFKFDETLIELLRFAREGDSFESVLVELDEEDGSTTLDFTFRSGDSSYGFTLDEGSYLYKRGDQYCKGSEGYFKTNYELEENNDESK
jgi:hypothetical protein